jgi:hypothetical protein
MYNLWKNTLTLAPLVPLLVFSPICKILGCVDVSVVLVDISIQEKVNKYTLEGGKTNWDKGLFEKINDVILSFASHLGDEWAT